VRSERTDFYVYEHWRPDTNVCFYIGKGKGRRAHEFAQNQRSKHHFRITDKLSRMGLIVEVRFISENLLEIDALRLEGERIRHWRALGVQLCNATEGGEGPGSGYKHTIESRAKIGAAHRGRKGKIPSAKTRALWSVQRKGNKSRRGQEFSEETRSRMSAASKGKPKSPEHRAKIRLAALNRSSEHIAKIAEGLARARSEGKGKPFQGKTHSAETKAKMSKAQKGRPKSPEHRAKLSAATQAWWDR
jgi:hypothetical protein